MNILHRVCRAPNLHCVCGVSLSRTVFVEVSILHRVCGGLYPAPSLSCTVFVERSIYIYIYTRTRCTFNIYIYIHTRTRCTFNIYIYIHIHAAIAFTDMFYGKKLAKTCTVFVERSIYIYTHTRVCCTFQYIYTHTSMLQHHLLIYSTYRFICIYIHIVPIYIVF